MNKKRKRTNSKRYTTDFKTPFIIAWSIWLFILVASIGYMWIKGYDIADEWNNNKDYILILSVGVGLMSVLFPVVAWQQVELDIVNKKLVIRKLTDLILRRYREVDVYKLKEIESKYRVRRGKILYLYLQNNTKQSINLSNLKKGDQLKEDIEELIP